MSRKARPRSRAVAAGQVRDLLAGSPHRPDPALAELAMAQAYAFDDGRALLVFEDGRGRLYESREALLAMVKEAERAGPAGPVPRLPHGRGFAGQVPRLIDELVEVAGRPGALDLGEASLAEVDALVRRLGADECLQPAMFARLVGYVGEVIRRATGGEWQMAPGADGEDWQAWVVDRHGHRYPASGLVLKELTEWSSASSLRGAVAGALGSHRLG